MAAASSETCDPAGGGHHTRGTLGLARFDMKYSNGALPHEKLLASIELYATRVVPLVREALAG